MATKTVAVTTVEVTGRTTVRLGFDDGVTRTVDLRPLMRAGMLEAVLRQRRFADVTIDAVSGNLAWPNGAQLPADVLRFRSGGYATRTN